MLEIVIFIILYYRNEQISVQTLQDELRLTKENLQEVNNKLFILERENNELKSKENK